MKFADAKTLRQYIMLVDEWLTTRQGFDTATLDRRLSNCVKIRLLRKALLERDIQISTGLAYTILETTLEAQDRIEF
jgi:hypothetical protein